MTSKWISVKPKSDEFEEFLEMYKALLSARTSEPERLKIKIQNMLKNLDMSKKKDFTDRLVAAGVLEPTVVSVIRSFNGSLAEFL